ncbi:MAG: histidine phosphatase family protein [Patescibacteria group bacterium]|nr:histidine phosphatase family protein [Patescibacteria group bacterium]
MNESEAQYRPEGLEQQEPHTRESELNEAELSHLKLYLFRHGKTDYLERRHVKEHKRWAPELDDLTEVGKEKLRERAETVAADLDPKKHIIVFFSSPRARAQSTAREISAVLKEKGFEIFNKPETLEVLRSGGDLSPTVGPNNEIVPAAGHSAELSDIDNEDKDVKTKGVRFKQFLSFFNAVDKTRLSNKIADPESGYHSKIPVFVGVTHGEVVHAGSYSEAEYRDSFLGNLFRNEEERAKLHRGDMLKFEFDLDHPGHATVEVRAKTSLRKTRKKIDFTFDAKDGSMSLS